MMTNLHRSIAVCVLLMIITKTSAQTKQLTIEACYALARQNYPLIKKQGLISKTTYYSVENAAKQFLPQVSLNAQATYQSETISFPKALSGASGISFPVISND